MSEPATATRPRRRWFSYGLRSLFVLITVASIGLAWVASERRQSQREMEIAERLKASGATVEVAGLFEDPSIEPPKEQTWWRRAFGNLLGLRVQGVDGNEALTDLSPLSGLKSIQGLALINTRVTDLAPLGRLNSLKGLALINTQVSDLTPLAGLTNLQRLWLNGTHVSDLSPLAGLVNLQDIYMTGTPVSEEQVNLLQQALPNCRILR